MKEIGQKDAKALVAGCPDPSVLPAKLAIIKGPYAGLMAYPGAIVKHTDGHSYAICQIESKAPKWYAFQVNTEVRRFG